MIDPEDSSLDYVTVAGVPSPGRATISGVKIPYNWDIKESYGKEGAFMVFKGRGLVRFTMTIMLWETSHFIQWEGFAKLLRPPTSFQPLVVQIGHPLLTAADVKAVAITELGTPERQSDGTWLSTSQCVEYRPAKQALVKPRGAIPEVEKGKPIPPKTAADFALEAARAELEAKRTLSEGR